MDLGATSALPRNPPRNKENPELREGRSGAGGIVDESRDSFRPYLQGAGQAFLSPHHYENFIDGSVNLRQFVGSCEG